MTLGLVGQKLGMTRLFQANGDSAAVTVLEFSPNTVIQVKSSATDGYSAVQLAARQCGLNKLDKAEVGHLKKAGQGGADWLYELRVSESELAAMPVGTSVTVDAFTVGQKVDVSGVSIGKGFAGVIKKYHFRTQDATHGNSLSHRAPGSIGQRQTPGRVWKGKKMCGHMGAEKRSILNLEVLKVDAEKGLLFVSGAVPGAKGGRVFIRPAVKAKAKGVK